MAAAAPSNPGTRALRSAALLALAGTSILLLACAPVLRSPPAHSGAAPTLPAPQRSWFPTVNIAPAKGWPSGALPRSASGTRVLVFASGLDHPRWLHVLPNGDVLVAESNAPAKRAGSTGIKARAGFTGGWLCGLPGMNGNDSTSVPEGYSLPAVTVGCIG